MKPHQLKAFLAVAELRSIRRAAKTLHLSQPTVTRTMRELEADLGVPLLVRSARGIDLTEYGKAFELRTRLLVHESRRAREELQQIADGVTGSVEIAATALAGLTVLPPALAAFRKRMPGAQVHCADGQLPGALAPLRSGRLDFLLANLNADATPADLQCESLLQNPQVVGARVGHPHQRRRSLSALLDEEWVVPDRSLLQEAFSRQNLRVPARVLCVESFGVALGLVANSDAIGLFSMAAMDTLLRHSGVRRIPVSEPLPPALVSVLTRRSAVLTPAAAALLAALRESAARLPIRLRS